MGKAQRSRLMAVTLLMVSTGVVGLVGQQAASAATTKVASLQNVVPAPVTVKPAKNTTFTLGPSAKIFTVPAARDVAGYLAGILRRSTGYPLPVSSTPTGSPAKGISLLLNGADSSVGAQGYQLDITS